MEERTNETFVLIAQKQILKILIDNPNLQIPEITGDSFSNPKFKAYYQAIINLRDSNEDITDTTLLREANRLNEDIDLTTTQNIIEQNVTINNLEGALNALRDALAKHKINVITSKIQDLTTSFDPLDTTKLSSLEYEIQETLLKSYKQTVSKDFDTILTEYADELRERRKGLYYPFNDTFLDSHLTKKAAPGQIITIAGSTGTGKSIFGLYLMSGLVNTDIPCMYFSPEMDEMSTFDRWMAMRHEIPIEQWYSLGASMDPLIQRVEEEKESLKGKAFRFIDNPDINLDQISNLIRDFKVCYKVDYAIILIDLLTQVKEFIDTAGNRNSSLPVIIEKGINKLNTIAKNENCCIIGIVQMNREADSAKVKEIVDIQQLRPTRNNIKNSSAIAERSRTVLSIFRERYYADSLLPNDPETPFIPDVLEVQILKQNMGKVGAIGKYNFNGPTFSIHELIEGPREEENL